MGTRRNIMAQVDSRLKTILVANGYQTNLGQKVFEWRETNVPDDDLPCVIYRDSSCPVIGSDSVYRDNALSVEFEILVSSGSITPTDIRKMIEDVLKAVGTDVNWNDNAYDTDYEGDESLMEQENKIYGGLLMKFVIGYQSKKWEN